MADREIFLGFAIVSHLQTQQGRFIKLLDFLARATVGTSLYVLPRHSVSSLVSMFLFFKTWVLLDHVGSRNFARKKYVQVSIHILFMSGVSNRILIL